MNRCVIKLTLLVLILSGVPGCRLSGQEADQYAVLVNSSREVLEEIKQHVHDAIGDTGLLISESAFGKTSLLIIERKRHATLDQGVVAGRSLENPHHFRLVIRSPNCGLVHEQTGRYFPLEKASCRLLDAE